MEINSIVAKVEAIDEDKDQNAMIDYAIIGKAHIYRK